MSKYNFTLEKEFRFEAAHLLPSHQGKCGRLHGHSWVGKLVVSGDNLQVSGSSSGMLMDFGDMKKPLSVLLDQYLDHHYLNDTLPLTNPTSEEVARWIYEQLKPQMPMLIAVQINETCTSSCRYEP